MNRRVTLALALASATMIGVSASHAQSPSIPSPMAYVIAAGQSDEFEIQEGQMAQQMSKSSAVKKFGAAMVKDHTKSTEIVMAAAAKSGMPSMPPPPLTEEQTQNIAKLQAASPSDFDGVYIRQQDKAHQDALLLQQTYANSGTDKNLQMAAAKIVPVVQMHASMVASLKEGQ